MTDSIASGKTYSVGAPRKNDWNERRAPGVFVLRRGRGLEKREFGAWFMYSKNPAAGTP